MGEGKAGFCTFIKASFNYEIVILSNLLSLYFIFKNKEILQKGGK